MRNSDLRSSLKRESLCVECYFYFVGGSFTYDYKLNFFLNQGLVDVLICLICYEQLDVVRGEKM